jgi:hypothetical protein
LPAAARADAAIERNQRLSGFEQNRLSAAEVSAAWAIADIERESLRVQVLDHDPISRIMISSFCWSMIFSENRFPLFRIMLSE